MFRHIIPFKYILLSGSVVFLLIGVSVLQAQSTVLDAYIQTGLESNLALKQQQFDLEKSRAVLKEARGLYFPSLSIEARYSRAGGGRVIDFPVGDLLNPIYGTLNQLLQQNAFPTDLENVETRFLRSREQETRLRVVQPVFQPAIGHNIRIRSSLADARAARVDAFERDLVLEIKTSYFNYLKTVQVVELLETTETVLAENVRVSQKLVQYNKATEDVIYRARAEQSKLEQQKAEAEKDRTLAASHFNFLLNRPLDAPISVAEPTDFSIAPPLSLSNALLQATAERDELRRLGFGIQAADHQVNLARSKNLPTLSLVFDYGLQGETYAFNNDADFWMASAVLQWNLFDGFQKQAKREQAQLEKNRLDAQHLELRQQIALQVQDAYHSVVVAQASIESAREQKASAQKSFDLVARKYELGLTNQLTFLDARTTLTSAGINEIITTFDFFIKQAEYERATALYPLPKQ